MVLSGTRARVFLAMCVVQLLGTLLCTVSPANAASFIVGEGVLFGISVGAGVLSGIQAMPASPIDEIRAT